MFFQQRVKSLNMAGALPPCLYLCFLCILCLPFYHTNAPYHHAYTFVSSVYFVYLFTILMPLTTMIIPLFPNASLSWARVKYQKNEFSQLWAEFASFCKNRWSFPHSSLPVYLINFYIDGPCHHAPFLTLVYLFTFHTDGSLVSKLLISTNVKLEIRKKI